MKNLVRTLVLGSALPLWAGAAEAKSIVNLHCGEPKCAYSEELGPDKTHTYRGYCGNKDPSDYSMACYAVKGTTCLPGSQAAQWWYCECTNWNAAKRKYVTIDLYC